MPGKRWMATIRYRDGTKPLFIEFEEIADLHDIIELRSLLTTDRP